MKKCAILFALTLSVLPATNQAQVAVTEQSGYQLPQVVLETVTTLAGQCDVLFLGETHGTKEVPAIAEELLAPLTKLGYKTIALEVPHDEQRAIEAWATSKSDVAPAFFATPGSDGRGNLQLLALVRSALSPPYQWKLLCFDETEEELMRQMMALLPKDGAGTLAERAGKLPFDEIVVLSVQRDALMAKIFAAGWRTMPTNEKVLAICGNLHARTANHAVDESPLKTLWPSFAAVLKREFPDRQLLSVNVQAFGGEYFNGGKVNKFNERPLDKVEAHPTADADWDYELNLPQATVATFLQPPASMNELKQ